jgi:hypothetical protein
MSNHDATLLRNVTGAVFRANPEYELVLFDRLAPEQRVLLADIQNDPDLYGVLRPCGDAGLGLKSVCRNTALLYLTLREPGELPGYVRTIFGERSNQAIAELVLDGVLEIESDGVFVSGSNAHGLLYTARPAVDNSGFIPALSIEALRYAQALEITDAATLSARMYFYNRVPATPTWMLRFPTPHAVAGHLGLDETGSMTRLLRRSWSMVASTPAYNGWRMWRHKDVGEQPRETRITFKLYISPACGAVREAFEIVANTMTEAEVPCFKVGHDVYGLLRPDKIIAYFWSFEHLSQVAERLREKLCGIPAHGVPFTAELTDDGLLSWGMDPPRDLQSLRWQERESWRLWLTNRLATALLAAKATKSVRPEPWQFAVDRLQLDGVDTDSWTPHSAIWDKYLSDSE